MYMEQEVDRGIEFLDQKYGPEWREVIDWESLDMQDGCNCIGGQLESYYRGDGDFFSWLRVEGLSFDQARDCGMYVAYDPSLREGEIRERYRKLRETWTVKGAPVNV